MIEELQEYCSNKRTAREITIINCELNDVDLNNLRADGLVFKNVDMSHVDLNHIHWRNCEISESKLDNVIFKQAILRMCSWQNVHAKNCDCSEMIFENSEAQGCQFENANFEKASLVDSDFSRASLRNANLTNADVTGINLRGADLAGANCDYVNFSDADLRGADFSGAKLDKSNLQGADVRGAIFDPNVEPVQETEQFTPMFSPENQVLANAIAPLLVSLLKKGGDKELFSEATEAKLMQDLEGIVNLSEDTDSPVQANYDEVIGSILNQAGNVGISELINALHDDEETPSEVISEMLKEFSNDMKLKENATTEDLLEKIVKSFN